MEKAKNTARATLSAVGDGLENLERRRVMLSKLNGVQAVGVNYLTGMVYVEYDSGKVTLRKIRTMLRRPLK